MKGVIESVQKGSCPVCKENIGLVLVSTQKVLRLIAQQEIICRTCCFTYKNSAVHACEGAGQAPAVTPQPQQPVVDPDLSRLCRRFWKMYRQENFH